MMLPDFQRYPLVSVVAQEIHTGEVLMVAHMNQEAFEETLRTGRVCYYSRSRGRLWRKGEESGHVQLLRELYVDCDGDAVLVKVEQLGGAACHAGYRSCFYRRFESRTGSWQIVGTRVFDPEKVYGVAEKLQEENRDVEPS